MNITDQKPPPPPSSNKPFTEVPYSINRGHLFNENKRVISNNMNVWNNSHKEWKTTINPRDRRPFYGNFKDSRGRFDSSYFSPLPPPPTFPAPQYNKRSAGFLSSPSTQKNISTHQYSNIQSESGYCNNCGKNGHGFYQCKNPITSYGIIVFRYFKNPLNGQKERQYLMIRRRDTISYVDFLRGKYSLFNRKYIKSLIKDMSEFEQTQIMNYSFDYLWYELWKNNEPNPNDKIRESFEATIQSTPPLTAPSLPIPSVPDFANESFLQPRSNDKYTTKEKFNILQNGYFINDKRHFTIAEIVDELNKEREVSGTENWKEPEWGFCKGRRNYKESDYDCAVREMEEETGYSRENMSIIKNINTFEEVFIGSNFKCYKHKYYLMYMTYENSLKTGSFEKTEVSCIKWASFKECLSLIRSYNVEKKNMISEVEHGLNKYAIFS